MPLYNICENIKRVRKEAGKTQQELADLLNVKRSTYATWELSTVPDVITLIEIGKALNVDWTSLVKETIVGTPIEPGLTDSELIRIYANEILKLIDKQKQK